MTVLKVIYLVCRIAKLINLSDQYHYKLIPLLMLFRIIIWIFTRYNNLKKLKHTILSNMLLKFSLLPRFYKINDLVWQDGLLLDFLQKKVVDKWVRRFLVLSSYLFSERILFKFVVRFYVDYITWPTTTASIFEFTNISWMLHSTLLALIIFISIFNLHYIYMYTFL